MLAIHRVPPGLCRASAAESSFQQLSLAGQNTRLRFPAGFALQPTRSRQVQLRPQAAVLIGDVTVVAKASIRFGAVLRWGFGRIRVGPGTETGRASIRTCASATSRILESSMCRSVAWSGALIYTSRGESPLPLWTTVVSSVLSIYYVSVSSGFLRAPCTRSSQRP
jgi:hypothetical protein